MSSALRRIKRSPHFFASRQIEIIKRQKSTIFLYKGKEKDHPICQFHIKDVGAKLANKLDTKIVGDMGTKAELERIGRTELACEVCSPFISTEPILEAITKEILK